MGCIRSKISLLWGAVEGDWTRKWGALWWRESRVVGGAREPGWPLFRFRNNWPLRHFEIEPLDRRKNAEIFMHLEKFSF